MNVKKMNIKSIYIENFGCIRRAIDSSNFENYFHLNGIKTTRNPKSADCILFITCGAKKIEENIAFKKIKSLKKYKGKLIVGGCLNSFDPQKLKSEYTGHTILTSDFENIDQFFLNFKIKYKDIKDANLPYTGSFFKRAFEYLPAIRFDANFLLRLNEHIKRRYSKKRCYVRIGWGCMKEHCTFCSVWRSIGELKSKPIKDIIEEFKRNIGYGYEKIALLADNLGAYGIDIDLTLIHLLKEISKVRGNYKLELEDLHPMWLIKYINDIKILSKDLYISYILCAIQSGNNRILKLMNRRHNKEDLVNAIQIIKTIYPEITLHTQIIVGFPSETNEEFIETIQLVKDLGFNLVQVYGYSKNPYLKNPEIVTHEISSDIVKERIAMAIKYFKRNKIACAKE